jgi:endonuclease-3
MAMPATVNKQKLLTHLLALKSRYHPTVPEARPVMEQILFAICREDATCEQAERAYRNLLEQFFDWNEIRVSSPREIAEALGELPAAENRAQRLIAVLQEVFETTFSFDLEMLHKKGMKQAARQLGRFQGANDYTVAWITQHSLGGHAIPLDSMTLRALRRMGLLDASEDDPEAIRTAVEHLVPKVKGPLFGELMSALADEYCLEEEPKCVECTMARECQMGQELIRQVPSGRGGKPKPR